MEAGNDTFNYLEVTKTLLGIKDNISDNFLLLLIEKTKQSILNYCNVSELPASLNYTLCSMCCDTFRELTSKNNVGEVAGNVTSVSEGGRTVSFGNSSDMQTSIENRITLTTELKRYRKLYRI